MFFSPNQQSARDYVQGKGWEHKEQSGQIILQTCPFCNDERWHFYIDPDEGPFYCHKCQARGNLITLKKEMGDFEAPAKQQPFNRQTKKRFKKPAPDAADRYHKALPIAPGLLSYLQSRGITSESIKRFKLGLFSRNGTQWLTIPHFEAGELINIKYRSVPPAEKTFRREKDCRSVLFNGDVLNNVDEIIVTEGEIDAITLVQAGFENTVGVTAGAGSFPREWIDQLKGIKRIYLAFDGDETGQKGTRSIAKLLGHERCFHLQLPEGRDINDFFRDHDVFDFQQLLNQASPIAEPEAPNPFAFPDDLMTGVAGELARLYSTYTEPPAVFFYFAYLTCLGAMLTGNLTLASAIYPQPRLYTILLGESADDRKSTALFATSKFFLQFFSAVFEVSYGVGSAEGLQDHLNESSGGRLLILLDEFKSFVNKAKIENSVLLPCVNTLFEQNRYESRTKKRDIRLTNAHLCLLAASTVQTYETIWTSQFLDIGLPNRLFLVPGRGRRCFPIPREIPEEEKKALADRTEKILRMVGNGLRMTVEPEAYKEFEGWYLNLESSTHSKRIDTYALRLMPLLAINDGKTSVDADTIRKIVRIMNWQLEVRRQLDPIDAESAVAKMEEKIRRALRASGRLTDRELKRATHYNREGIWIFNQALKNLSDGRDREIWFDGKGKTWGLLR
jgi:5S rRNA maturation endonuclease (ribonuclease M5)